MVQNSETPGSQGFDEENVQVFIRMIEAIRAEPAIPQLMYPIGYQPHFLASVAIDELYSIAHRPDQTEFENKNNMSVVMALFYRHALGMGFALAKRKTPRKKRR